MDDQEIPEGFLELKMEPTEQTMLALLDSAQIAGGQEIIDRLVSAGVLVYEGNNTYRLVPEMIPGT